MKLNSPKLKKIIFLHFPELGRGGQSYVEGGKSYVKDTGYSYREGGHSYKHGGQSYVKGDNYYGDVVVKKHKTRKSSSSSSSSDKKRYKKYKQHNVDLGREINLHEDNARVSEHVTNKNFEMVVEKPVVVEKIIEVPWLCLYLSFIYIYDV